MLNKLDKKFLEKLNSIHTKSELEIIKKGFETSNPSVFRINKLKNDHDVIKEFNENKYEIERINYLENGYKIIKQGNIKISNLKSFKQGYIYLQSISSQISTEIIDLEKDNSDFKILDLTAAPGGKSTSISARMKNKGEIITCEKNSIRTEKLKHNIEKLGAKNIKIVKEDANNLKNIFQEGHFDVIIADLPCSAEGRVNLNIEKSYKYLENPGINKRNYKIQQNILKNNMGLLKSGGQLIYSTCTIDPLENEAIIHYLLSNFGYLEPEDISSYFNEEKIKNISKQGVDKYLKYIFKKEIKKAIRILPSEETHGFFIAKLRKK